jgi:hypothetical protein
LTGTEIFHSNCQTKTGIETVYTTLISAPKRRRFGAALCMARFCLMQKIISIENNVTEKNGKI